MRYQAYFNFVSWREPTFYSAVIRQFENDVNSCGISRVWLRRESLSLQFALLLERLEPRKKLQWNEKNIMIAIEEQRCL